MVNKFHKGQILEIILSWKEYNIVKLIQILGSTKQRIVLTRFEGSSCAGKRPVTLLILHTFDYDFFPRSGASLYAAWKVAVKEI